MIVQSILLIISSYLVGSIPAAYVAGRLFKNIDLRQYGSGTVSGSMVWEHVGKWALIPVIVVDLGKVMLPTWLGLHLGLGTPVAAAAGMAAVVGHCWPIFLNFTGGRGLGGYVAILFILFSWGVVWLVGFLAIGWRLGDSAPWALAALLTLPLFAHLIGGPDVVTPLAGIMLLLMLIKRLEANRRPLPPSGPEQRRTILRRLFLDRDIADHQEWINRRPDREANA
ncbi:MAG: glycerol-3-phosphate acyltransferase [Anaerolineae bacterium]|jgi:glycerol-3-phosphate acyltransferase PlsY